MGSGQYDRAPAIVLISADVEWSAVLDLLGQSSCNQSPFGGWFETSFRAGGVTLPVIFFQGGWGKISAASSTQYVIDRWNPRLLVNLGTCGGLSGRIERGQVLLVERTIVYDILEQMGNSEEHIAHYSTDLDLSWLSSQHPQPARRSLLVSADRDLLPTDIHELAERYGAVAADWESGAIAWVAVRNGCRCLILRGVTDLVSTAKGELYGDMAGFHQAAHVIMRRLLNDLPGWLEAAGVVVRPL